MVLLWKQRTEEPEAADGWEEEPVSGQRSRQKPVFRIFMLTDVKNASRIVDFALEGNIAVINIRPLRYKNTFELKYAVDKMKKGVRGKGDIAGLPGDYIILTGRNFVIARK